MHAFKLTEVRGNIFHAPRTHSLAHAVSADLHTAKHTIAWQFALIFGRMDDLGQQQIETGSAAVLEDKSRFIYFLVTKNNLYERSTYEHVEAALICMRGHMRQHEIFKVAMPRIGCGNDQLEWQRVKKIIERVFSNEYLVEILVYEHVAPLLMTPKCVVLEVKGNIFNVSADTSMAHSVPADFSLTKGIGYWFKQRYGQINELVRQNKHTGNVAIINVENNRYIYNLVTKERSHEKCTYPALYYALVAMREHMRQHNVKKVAVPRLGCGIDHLDWSRVKEILEYVFAEDIVIILAYLYDGTVSTDFKMAGSLHFEEQCQKCKRPI